MEIEEKYDAKMILRHVWGKYFSQPDMKIASLMNIKFLLRLKKAITIAISLLLKKISPLNCGKVSAQDLIGEKLET